MQISLLDVGKVKYGDCILVSHGGRNILIDGGHPGDTDRIRAQLKTLLGHAPPFKVDLLIVTHCHSDHIGCLPALVDAGDLTADVAVVADEKLGFGRDANDASPIDALPLSDAQRALTVALQEEDHSDLPPAELEQFLQDALSLEDKYKGMLESLGGSVIRFGRDSPARIGKVESDFADFGLKFLGPTREHLVLCAEVLQQDSDAVANEILQDAATREASPQALAAAYKRWVQRLPGSADDPEFAADRPGPGAAKNDQSIVLSVSAGGWTALLAGDMQFAKAEVPGLTPVMKTLRRKVVEAGPYDFVKFSHHTSYNGVDESVMRDFASTRAFAHTGGLNDPDHPDPTVLKKLEGMSDKFKFARTDHNGLIKVTRSGSGVKMTVQRGALNDFTPNAPPDTPTRPTTQPPREGPERESARETAPATAEATVLRRTAMDVVEVSARVPHTDTRVTITIEVEPGKKKAVKAREVEPIEPVERAGRAEQGQPADAVRVGGPGGRTMPKLVVVTHAERLGNNIGRGEAAAVLGALRSTPNLRLVELSDSAADGAAAAAVVRPSLGGDVAGVLIVGGYDVVPAQKLNVLDDGLRQAVKDAGFEGDDADDFYVWSDELYGDRDGDRIPEVPVSRVPDGRLADVTRGALSAPRFVGGRRFGVHNVNRPFAKEIFPFVPGAEEVRLETSETFSPSDVAAGAAAGAVYYMLHGSARDGTTFWGETPGGSAVEAVDVGNVPAAAPGSVVFSGCCWGALTASPPAARAGPGTPLRPRGPEASIAVAYLRAGALGFVGCTGSHYSPLRPPFNFFGRPMHEAFWRAIAAGKGPAEALFLAKLDFIKGMPHGRTDPFSRAVELKILRQFTCLGLGW